MQSGWNVTGAVIGAERPEPLGHGRAGRACGPVGCADCVGGLMPFPDPHDRPLSSAEIVLFWSLIGFQGLGALGMAMAVAAWLSG